MIDFSKFTLNNGLRVIVHEDDSTPLAVVNILYDVGSRDEDPERTGFAHLFEHLMFGGSVNIPEYDTELQRAGGTNNAFTNQDITNYFVSLPAVNLETAFWLESDRMFSLNFDEKVLENQKNVVSEEFKERYLNQPYGDAWLKLNPLAYKEHPYQWSTIGKNLEQIEAVKLNHVKDFFFKYYRPNNAIMVVGGNVKKDKVQALAEKWFGPIEEGKVPKRSLPKEPEQKEAREDSIVQDVPAEAIYKAYHICNRTDDRFYAFDLLSDILSSGESSRLYRNLVVEQKLFSSISAYHTGNIDEGLFVIEGKLFNDVKMADGEKAINLELEKLSENLVEEDELQKVKNKIESALIFEEVNILNKCMELAYFELLGDASMINNEIEKYKMVNAEDIRTCVKQFLNHEKASNLYYRAALN